MAIRFPRKKLIHYLIMVLLVMVSSVILAELMLRLFARVSVQGVHTASEQVFNRIPGVFEPGQDVVVQPRKELTHRVSINSLGYRGRDISPQKSPGTIRILCLGDSVTFGDFVNNNETYPHHLQALFEENLMPVEVINAGVGGTTIVDHLYFLRKSMEIQPDIVILTFSENDIDDLSRREAMYVSLERNRKLKSAPGLGIIYRLVRDTALFNFALSLWARYGNYRTPAKEAMKEKELPEPTSNKGDVLWGRYEEILREMKVYLDQHSVRFIFATFPSHFQIGWGSGLNSRSADVLDRIEKIAKAMGISTMNYLGPLRSSRLGRNKLYLLPYDGHPSSVAYSIVAKALFERLRSANATWGLRWNTRRERISRLKHLRV